MSSSRPARVSAAHLARDAIPSKSRMFGCALFGISGVRFAKPVENTGSHVGRLWRADGALLAEVDFTNETAEGWQEATFGQPVAVATNTTYIASYYTPTGNYVTTENYFASRNFLSPPLQTGFHYTRPASRASPPGCTATAWAAVSPTRHGTTATTG
jgi:hypothetical protein